MNSSLIYWVGSDLVTVILAGTLTEQQLQIVERCCLPKLTIPEPWATALRASAGPVRSDATRFACARPSIRVTNDRPTTTAITTQGFYRMLRRTSAEHYLASATSWLSLARQMSSDGAQVFSSSWQRFLAKELSRAFLYLTAALLVLLEPAQSALFSPNVNRAGDDPLFLADPFHIALAYKCLGRQVPSIVINLHSRDFRALGEREMVFAEAQKLHEAAIKLLVTL